MKVKLLTLLAAIFMLGNVSSAQGVGTFKAKKKSTIVKKNLAPQRQGTFIMPKLGVGINVDAELSTLNLQAVLGYEFNNHFAIGVGIGFDNYYYFHNTGYRGTNMYIYDLNLNLNYNYGYVYEKRRLTSSIPLYINIHGDFSRHRTTAYYSLDLGVHMPIIKALGSTWGYKGIPLKYYCKGFFVSPEIGIKFNNCYLGANFTYTKVHEIFDVDFDIDSYIDYTSFLSLKFGYKIPLKNVRL